MEEKAFENSLLEAGRTVVSRLKREGFEAYLAGGCVRDRLLGLAPKDADVATDASPDAVLALFSGSRAVGRAFGVVRVPMENHWIEVATFRVDGPYSDGRRPDWVRRATAEEDVKRRDFTINAMFLDPQSDRLLDWVEGEKDLRNGLVRSVGAPADRFREDALRLFRAVRFAARLDFRIEEHTWNAMVDMPGITENLSPERVRGELTAMIRGPNPGRAIRLLREAGLLAIWLPEVDRLSGIEQPADHHPEGDAFVHTCRALDGLARPSATLAWGVLLHDIGKPDSLLMERDRIRFPGHAEKGAERIPTIARRLAWSKEREKSVTDLVRRHARFPDVPNMRPATKKRFLASENFAELLELHRADRLSSSGDLSVYEDIRRTLKRHPEAARLPDPLLTGDDLLNLGVPQGPDIGRILNALSEEQLDGRLAGKEDALRRAEKLRKDGNERS